MTSKAIICFLNQIVSQKMYFLSILFAQLLLLNSNSVYMYINKNHKNKNVITLVGNSSIKLL